MDHFLWIQMVYFASLLYSSFESFNTSIRVLVAGKYLSQIKLIWNMSVQRLLKSFLKSSSVFQMCFSQSENLISNVVG